MRKKELTRPSGSLLIKIFAGYTMLILLVVGIIVALWHEKRVFREAEAEENAMLVQRELTSRTFKALVSLFLDNESAYLRDSSTPEQYSEKENRVFTLLEELRKVYTDSLQLARIDTVEYLLSQKHEHIRSFIKIPAVLMQVDSILAKQLPELERSVVTTATAIQKNEPEKKTFLSRLFPRKQKRSQSTTSGSSSVHVRSIQNIGAEMYGVLERQGRLFESMVDSLDQRNKILNRNISRLINELEKDAMLRTAERHRRVSELREEAFVLICIISVAALFFALMLCIFISRDIHHKYRNRKVLEESNRRNEEMLKIRNQIIVTLSHDIRGPLGTIKGGAELAMDTRDRKRRNVYLRNIMDSAVHIMRQVNSLLDLSRLNEAGEVLNETLFRLDRFLSTIESEYGRIANDKGLLLVGDFKGTGVVVYGDSDRINRIISNFLSNAIKFTESGTIRFSALYSDSTLTITVSDTGIGMSADTLNRIFVPFERAAEKVCPEGFGLGLPITKGLVALFGGNISVESRIGEGSSFKVNIPLKESQEPVMDKPDRPMKPIKKLPRRIIVIDDNPVQLEITREILERNGIRCYACLNVKEVVSLLRKGVYDLLMTDIQMPETNGFDLLKLLRNSNIGCSRSIPIIAMTARGDQDKESLIRAGFTECIHKSFSGIDLLPFLSSVMEGLSECTVSFETLITDTDNRHEVLTMVLKESQENLKSLDMAMQEMSRNMMRETVHRMYPMWEMLNLADSLQEYRALLRDEASDDQTLKEATLRIKECLIKLIEETEKEINNIAVLEHEKENTDSGR